MLAQNVDAYGNITATYYVPANLSSPQNYSTGAPSYLLAGGAAVGGPYYWSTPATAPTLLSVPSAFTMVNVTGASSTTGTLVGYGVTSSASSSLYWASPTSMAVKLQGSDLSPTAVSSDGKIVGTQSSSVSMGYWPSASSAPIYINGGGDALIPQGVNKQGMYVGYAQSGNSNGQYGFIGTKDGFVSLDTKLDAASAGYKFDAVTGINDLGWITGRAFMPNGKFVGFLGVPVQ